MPSMATDSPSSVQNSPLLKHLASSNPKVRKDALDTLKVYLSRRGVFENIELLKMWKGLFYTMWMCDKPRNQQELAIELAALVDTTLATINVLPFLEAFWQTIAREWSGIDSLRMDKFLFLVRQYLAASFRYLSRPAKESPDQAGVNSCISILNNIPLNSTDQRIPNGLRYHVLDIFVDELDNVDRVHVAGNVQRSGKFPLDQLLQPIRSLQSDCPTKSVRTRATEVLEDARLKAWNSIHDDIYQQGAGVVNTADDNNTDDWAGFDD